MPSLSWYIQRLSAMSPAEIPWRIGRRLGAEAGRFRKWPTAPEMDFGAIWNGPATAREFCASHAPQLPVPPSDAELAAWPQEWKKRCIDEANDLLERRFSFFTFDRKPLGEAIDWNRDYDSGKYVLAGYAPSLDYRDASRVGDVKYTWELARQQHLVRLAQAWRLTRDERYAREAVAQITSFIEQCPWMRGIHWTSAMESALRLITWTWTFELLRPWEGLDDSFFRVLVASIHQHLAFIESHYSLHSSANNHLVAEASGACVAAHYWTGLCHSAKWGARARAILEREILNQNWPDGANKEQAFGYQFFVYDLFLLPILQARRAGRPFPAECEKRLDKMAEFLAWTTDSSGNTPQVGDQDDGWAVSLAGRHPDRAAGLLNAAAVFGQRADFHNWAGEWDERTSWLFTADERAKVPPTPTAPDRSTRLFPDGGYAVLRKGRGADEFLLLFDFGPLGWPATAAHGHCDLLGIWLHVGSRPILIDPGTHSYRDNEWRRKMRATALHNTLSFPNSDQAQYLNRFMWGKRPTVRLTRFEDSGSETCVSAEAAWWTGEIHRRTLLWKPSEGLLIITDQWEGSHSPEIGFLLASNVHAQARESETQLDFGGSRLSVHADSGSWKVEQALCSPRCYSLVPTPRLVLSGLQPKGTVATHWKLTQFPS